MNDVDTFHCCGISDLSRAAFPASSTTRAPTPLVTAQVDQGGIDVQAADEIVDDDGHGNRSVSTLVTYTDNRNRAAVRLRTHECSVQLWCHQLNHIAEIPTIDNASDDVLVIPDVLGDLVGIIETTHVDKDNTPMLKQIWSFQSESISKTILTESS